MVQVYNCGEQEIEDGGISISMTFCREKEDSPKTVFINITDNLLGISEFIINSGYKYAEVGINYDTEKEPPKSYLSLLTFLNKQENKEVKALLEKYVKLYEEDAKIENNTVWYYFMLESKGKEMSVEDSLKFKRIFEDMVKVC